MELDYWIEHRRITSDSTVRYNMLASIVAFGGTSPPHQAEMERDLGISILTVLSLTDLNTFFEIGKMVAQGGCRLPNESSKDQKACVKEDLPSG